MRIVATKFAMVPTWVALHPEMHGQGSRMAVYVAIRVVAFEMPDYEWRSDRELAGSIAPMVGVGAESCRKHIRAMRDATIIGGDFGELIILDDQPRSGEPDGESVPHVGNTARVIGESVPHSPITKRGKRSTPPTEEAAGESEQNLDNATIAREAATKFYDWVKEQTGKPPVGIKFMALAKLIESFLHVGWELNDVKWAVRRTYEDSRPWQLAVIEQYLDGRADIRRPPSKGASRTLDALQRAIEAESDVSPR